MRARAGPASAPRRAVRCRALAAPSSGPGKPRQQRLRPRPRDRESEPAGQPGVREGSGLEPVRFARCCHCCAARVLRSCAGRDWARGFGTGFVELRGLGHGRVRRRKTKAEELRITMRRGRRIQNSLIARLQRAEQGPSPGAKRWHRPLRAGRGFRTAR